MIRNRIGFYCITMGSSIFLLSLVWWGVLAGRTEGFVEDIAGPIQTSFQPFDITSAEAITMFQYLPALSLWVPPCGGIPVLTAPANGATVTMDTNFAMDGSRAGGEWLQLDFSTSPDFTGFRRTYFLQPAGPWSKPLSEYTLYWIPTPGVYYWRASVWCGGPVWPPPPEGYQQSPFSEVRSFTLAP